jgi:hypothetical protein
MRARPLTPLHQILDRNQQGFVLPIALGMGLVMVLLGVNIIIRSQGVQTIATQRRQMGRSLLTTEGGVARTLAQLSDPNNAPLLARNYDSINPATGKTYLGPDGIANNGDEETTAVDEWSSFAPNAVDCTTLASPGSPTMTYGGVIGTEGQYTLKAYRYDPNQSTGTFFVEGQQGESTSQVAVTLTIEPDIPDFPGVLVTESGVLRGRTVLGTNGNVYYNPADSGNESLTSGAAAAGDPNRADFLDALWTGPADQFSSDSIGGKIVACPLSFSLPNSTPSGAEALGNLDGDRNLAGVSGSIKVYRADTLALTGNETVTVDTTAGPVYLYLTVGNFSMRGTLRILNIRTDGNPPQVGDLRIILTPLARSLTLYDYTCIQTAFIYIRTSDLHLETLGDGCPSSGDTNVDGVVWVEDVVNSINRLGGRSAEEDGDLSVTTNGVAAGIAVPEDVSSLSDLFESLNLPIAYKLGKVQHWQRVQL